MPSMADGTLALCRVPDPFAPKLARVNASAARIGSKFAAHPYIREFMQSGVAAMEAYKWFLLGMMVAWTPGLLALALLLWRYDVEVLGQGVDTSSRHMR